jgi:hypothetical protein
MTKKELDAKAIIAASPYKGNELIEEQDKIVGALVFEWNHIIGDYENRTIMWAMKVQEILRGYPDQTIKAVLEKIRQHPDLRSPMQSKDRIMQGIRLVRDEPKLVQWIKMTPAQRQRVPTEDRPYVKEDETLALNTEFYFLMKKWVIDPGFRGELEDRAKAEHWGTRRLIQEIQKLRQEAAEPNTRRRLQKAQAIKDVIFMIKDLQPEQIREVKDHIMHKFGPLLKSWNAYQENLEKEGKDGK